MALVLKDRVQETTAVVGTGTMTLAGAVLGFQTFAAIGNSNTTYYAVFDAITGDWEVGIGTYTASGTTLSRTTVLSSSNGGSLVSFAAGTKQVICTYPSERAVWVDSTNTSTVQNTFTSITATTATLTNGTVSTAPANPTDIVNKEYADAIASGINFHAACNYATTADLGAATYNNGTLGVGATLTKTAPFSTLAVDGGSPTVGQRILVKNQTSGQYNGAYVVTSVGSGAAGWVLTRATDYDTSGSGQNEIDQGDYFLILAGTTNANTSWIQQTALPIVVGTTALVFLQFAAPITYSAGTGLTLSPSTTFNITNTGVTAASYGIAASVPTIAVNAQGQITSASNTAIAIAAAAVSGLATSATTDTTNAANITSGTLPSGRISGSYTGLTGTGALAAGSLATGFTAVSAPLGGTGQTTYTIGDILYASTTTALSKLAAVAVGNVIISNGVGSAPSWGQVGLATSVSGTLPVANGGTGVTSSTGSGSNVLSTSPAITSATLTTPTVGSAGATFNGSTSGTTVFKAAAAAGTTTITMPGTTGTMALTSDIPTVSNGTLTMAVSGTGLSGSASFTANQSSASSFTVTSNATNANTASTIVARDASGNFTAGTITAALTGNASTATTATNQSGGTVSATTGAFSGNVTVSGTGAVTLQTGGDIIAYRSGGTTGVIYLNSAQTKYLYNDGTNYNLNGGAVVATNITSGGNVTGSSASCTGNAATATTATTATYYSATQQVNTLVTAVSTGTTPIVSGGSSAAMQVMGNTTNGAFFSFHRAGAYAVNLGLDTSNVVSLGGWSDGATSRWTSDTSGNFVARGNVTAYSDERLKKDWAPVTEDFVERLSKVKHGTYTRTDSNERQAGVSAQEWQKLLAETVLTSADGFLSVAYGNAALVAAVKLAERVVALEARLAALEAKG
jgi:hypothetical protein